MDKQFSSKFDIYSIVRDVLREWWVVLLFGAAIALFANVYVSFRYQPQYTSRATFAVTADRNGSTIYQDNSSAEDLAKRFTEVLGSNLLQKAVKEDLGLTSLSAETTVTQVEETNLVTLSVTADSPMMAYRIINSIMNNYDQVSDYVMSSVVLEVIEEPTIAMHASNTLDLKTPMLRAFEIAALLMVAYLAVRSYNRDTVKTEEQLKEKIDAASLGTIYHERNRISKKRRAKNSAKYSMLINNPLRSFGFVEANRMVAARVRSRMDQNGAKIALVTSVMENEGKSTVAANIAMGMAAEGKKVLLIDVDFRKPSQYKIFDVAPEDQTNLTQQLIQGRLEPNIVHRYRDSSLFIIANNKAPRSPDSVRYNKGVEIILKAYRNQMDYIILDTAPMALVSDTEDLASQTDVSIVVIREDEVLAKKINDVIDVLNHNGSKVLGCVFSNVTRRQGAGSGYGGYYGKYRRYGGYHGQTKE